MYSVYRYTVNISKYEAFTMRSVLRFNGSVRCIKIVYHRHREHCGLNETLKREKGLKVWAENGSLR